MSLLAALQTRAANKFAGYTKSFADLAHGSVTSHAMMQSPNTGIRSDPRAFGVSDCDFHHCDRSHRGTPMRMPPYTLKFLVCQRKGFVEACAIYSLSKDAYI